LIRRGEQSTEPQPPRTPTSGLSRAEVERMLAQLHDELHKEKSRRKELEISSRELDKDCRNVKSQVGGAERARDEAQRDSTEARMQTRLLETDLKAAKREVEDAKALMKLYEREAEVARTDADDARRQLHNVLQDLGAAHREIETLKAKIPISDGA